MGRIYFFDLTVDFFVDYSRVMNTSEKEPTPTIRAELGRRRLTVGRLAAATEMSEYRIQSRLSNPDEFRLGELVSVATALELAPGDLLKGWVEEVTRR